MLSKFHARVKSRLSQDTTDLKNLRSKCQGKPPSPSPSTSSLGGVLPHTRDDEEVCPICLLEMVEGESLMNCKEGCNNRLHQHCMEICKSVILLQAPNLLNLTHQKLVFMPHLTSSAMDYLTDTWQHGILLLNRCTVVLFTLLRLCFYRGR